MAVRIRMKMMGRKHRPYFRIVAIDHRQPRDGRVIEELGTYDPMVKNTDERVKLQPDADQVLDERRRHAVGTRGSVFIKKYMAKWEQKEAEAAAARRSAAARRRSRPGDG